MYVSTAIARRFFGVRADNADVDRQRDDPPPDKFIDNLNS